MSPTMRTTHVYTRDLSFGGIMRSEWIKLRSIRSTWWCLGSLAAITVALSAQLSSGLNFIGVPEEDITRDAIQAQAAYAGTTSTDFTALILCVLGVLIVAGEYGSGMIGPSLIAVPRRFPMLLGKAGVLAIATFVMSAMEFAVTVPISVALFSGNGYAFDLADPGYWLALLGGVVHLTSVGLIAFSIGALLRNAAGGVAVSLGLMFVVPLVISLIGTGVDHIWVSNLSQLLPSNLGKAAFTHPGFYAFSNPGAPEATLPPGQWVLESWQGTLGLVVWVVMLFTPAAVLLKRRDA